MAKNPVWILQITSERGREDQKIVYSSEKKAYQAAAEEVAICTKDQLDALEWEPEEAERLLEIIEMATRGGDLESLKSVLEEYQSIDSDYGPFDDHIEVDVAFKGR